MFARNCFANFFNSSEVNLVSNGRRKLDDIDTNLEFEPDLTFEKKNNISRNNIYSTEIN